MLLPKVDLNNDNKKETQAHENCYYPTGLSFFSFP